MNRRLFVFSLVIIFSLIVLPAYEASAETVEECSQSLISGDISISTNEQGAGLTPANTFYFADRFGDWMKLRLFSFTTDGKINTLLNQAQERIGELEVLQSQNNLRPQYVDSIVSSYNNKMVEIDERIVELETSNFDIVDIISRVAKMNGKNKVIIANILTSISDQNRASITDAYNNTNGSFCSTVNSWITRQNECNDSLLFNSSIDDMYNEMVGVVSDVNDRSIAVSQYFTEVDGYEDSLLAVRNDIVAQIENIDTLIQDHYSSVEEKNDELSALNNEFSAQPINDIINSQPSQDAVELMDLLSLKKNSSLSIWIAKARASASMVDIDIANSEVSADIHVAESITGQDSGDSMDYIAKNIIQARIDGLEDEIASIDSNIDAFTDGYSVLNTNLEECSNLRADFVKIQDELEDNKISRAAVLTAGLLEDINDLDNEYLPSCGVGPMISFLHGLFENSYVLSNNDRCSTDVYVQQLVAWMENQLDYWDSMIEFHNQLAGSYDEQVTTYSTVRAGKASSLADLESRLSTITPENIYTGGYYNFDRDFRTAEVEDVQDIIDELEEDLEEANEDVDILLGIKDIAEGNRTNANTAYTTAEGNVSNAEGELATAEGNRTTANTAYTTAEGNVAIAEGELATAEGNRTTANTAYTTAEGNVAIAEGELATAEGNRTTANISVTIAEGELNAINTTISAQEVAIADLKLEIQQLEEKIDSFTGYNPVTDFSIASLDPNYLDTLTRGEAETLKASKIAALVQDESKLAQFKIDRATAEGELATAEGNRNAANTAYTSAEGNLATAEGELATAEGNRTTANISVTIAEGNLATAEGELAAANGNRTTANTAVTTAEGNLATAEGELAAANGNRNAANTAYTSAEGNLVTAEGELAAANGNRNAANTAYTSAEGDYNVAVNTRDGFQTALDNSGTLEADLIDMEMRLDIIRQELNDFMATKLTNTISNYENTVAGLESVTDQWESVNNNYQSFNSNFAILRGYLDSADIAEAQDIIVGDLRTSVNEFQSENYPMPAFEIEYNLDSIDWLIDMNILGASRIESIFESVKESVLQLKAMTCEEADAIYNTGAELVCNELSTGNFLASCTTINNIESQIIDQCKLQPEHNCGNNDVDAGESCDDGNELSGDGCSSICQTEITLFCGDGIIQNPNSYGTEEECEDIPGNVLDGDGCSAQCLNEKEIVPICGDGILQQPNDAGLNEQCDDGNSYANDGCNNICRIERGANQTIRIKAKTP
jgi:cysteine-rich repeat protein